jgi:protein-L-isoaspartate(D-aspartate) O-methyltransferase
MSEFATRRVMMVDTQVRPSDVTKFPIIDAMLSVPRETFVPDDAARGGLCRRESGAGAGPGGAGGADAGQASGRAGYAAGRAGAGCGLRTWLFGGGHCAAGRDGRRGRRGRERWRPTHSESCPRRAWTTPSWSTGKLAEGSAKCAPYDVITLEGGVETVPEALLAQLKDGGPDRRGLHGRRCRHGEGRLQDRMAGSPGARVQRGGPGVCRASTRRAALPSEGLLRPRATRAPDHGIEHARGSCLAGHGRR